MAVIDHEASGEKRISDRGVGAETQETGHKFPVYTSYPFTAGWKGAWGVRKNRPNFFRSAQNLNPSSLLSAEPSVLPLHHGAPS